MNFSFTEEQEELRQAVRRFLQEKSPETEVRRLMETDEGYDPAVWHQMADQLGLQAIAIHESFGGAGFTFVELGIVLEEMGAALLCAPFFSSAVLASSVLLCSADEEAKARYLPAIAAGGVATVALVGDSGHPGIDTSTLSASPAGSTWKLDGHKSHVIDGQLDGLVLAVAASPEGTSLFAVEAGAEGLIRTPLATLDQTRKQARLEFVATPAELIGEVGKAEPGLIEGLRRTIIGLAHEQVGGAQRCLDMSVQYAKVRFQFGRPIGSFQAIKHKCADMLLEVESAKAAAHYAARVVSSNSDELPIVASLTKSFCSEAYAKVTAENIQIHGGIGFTWEHPAHLYLKRAKTSEMLFGDPTYHRALLAEAIGV
jgi:alkylation response protein AidB-like acyl-CoA dehydrogenase